MIAHSSFGNILETYYFFAKRGNFILSILLWTTITLKSTPIFLITTNQCAPNVCYMMFKFWYIMNSGNVNKLLYTTLAFVCTSPPPTYHGVFLSV